MIEMIPDIRFPWCCAPFTAVIRIPCEDRDPAPRTKTHTIPTNEIFVREADNLIVINGTVANIVDYDIIVPQKVMKVKFADGKTEKMVVREGDTFDLNTGLRIAVAKHVGRKYYNLKGIEAEAERYSHLKCIDKMLEKAHKNHQKAIAIREKSAKEAQDRAAKLKKAAEKQKSKPRPNCNSCRVYRHAEVDKLLNNQKTDAHHLNITKSKHGREKGKNKQ